jgi:hypothetical protein
MKGWLSKGVLKLTQNSWRNKLKKEDLERRRRKKGGLSKSVFKRKKRLRIRNKG